MKYLVLICFTGLLIFASCKNQKTTEAIPLQKVSAIAQTTSVPDSDDAADDPAIWINYDAPEESLIIGSNKQRGLHVYDLSGNEVFSNEAGKINNIDVRYGFKMADGSRIDIVAGSNRSFNSISVFKIGTDGRLQDIASGILKSELNGVYGFCLYKDLKEDKIYAFVNGKSGRVEQWHLFASSENKVDGSIVRTFKINSQPEGCVCDDEMGVLYLGEENKGIWKFEASPLGGSSGKLIADFSNKNLKPDIEGLALYYAEAGNGYLIASSQGNNTFAVFERKGANNYIGSFEVVNGNGIDGISNTDGIDVTNVGLGTQFPDGLFIAQDGFHVENGRKMNQNFKLISWKSIASHFNPPLHIDNLYQTEQVE